MPKKNEAIGAKANELQKSKQFSKLVGTISDEKITRKNCKCCNSKHRTAAEEIYEQRGSVKAVKRFLDSKGDVISYLAVRNHIHRHYMGQARNSYVKEWANDLGKYAGALGDRKYMILERLAIMRRDMCLIAAESDSVALDERRRSADIVKKLSDGMSTLEDKLDQLDKDLEPVEIVIENIKIILVTNEPELDQIARRRIHLSDVQIIKEENI